MKIESEMKFITDDYSYIMEDDSFYKQMSSKYGSKGVDFIIKRDNKLLFIEAKKSSPKKLEEYINEIVTKFTDSLIIFIGILFDRKNTKSIIITEQMNQTGHLKNDIQFILIIKDAEKSHLIPIRIALHNKLRKLIQMFSIENNVIVINENQAVSKNFLENSKI